MKQKYQVEQLTHTLTISFVFAQYKTNKSAVGRRYINEDEEKNIINENNKSAIGRRYTNEDAEKI